MELGKEVDYNKELLIRIAQYDDEEAFRLFFRNYYPRLMQFALLFVKHHYQAEEIVSDVMIKLLKNRKILCKIENVKGYLFLSVKNQAISLYRKQKNNYSFEPISAETESNVSDYSNPENKFIAEEFSALIAQTVEDMPEKRRMVFKLVREEKLKYKEVAELLDISVKTVENHLDLAIKMIRLVIQKYIDDNQSSSLLHKPSHRDV